MRGQPETRAGDQDKDLEFNSPKIIRPCSLIFISDVHLGSNPTRHAQNICRLIKPLDFDCLLIGGDLFDSSTFRPEDLSPFLDIKQPIYFVTGNHEYYVKDHHRKLQDLRQYNITILDNQTQTIGSLNLIGISDNQPVKNQADVVDGLRDDSKFNVVMVHQPSVWEAVSGSVDLMLSGHTHNGQIFRLIYWSACSSKPSMVCFRQRAQIYMFRLEAGHGARA